MACTVAEVLHGHSRLLAPDWSLACSLIDSLGTTILGFVEWLKMSNICKFTADQFCVGDCWSSPKPTYITGCVSLII